MKGIVRFLVSLICLGLLISTFSCSLHEKGNGDLRNQPEPPATPLIQEKTPPPQQDKLDLLIKAFIDLTKAIYAEKTINPETAAQPKTELKEPPAGAFGVDKTLETKKPVAKSEKSLEEVWRVVQSNSYRIGSVEKGMAELSLLVIAMNPGDQIALRIGSFASKNSELSPNLIKQADELVKIIKNDNLTMTELWGYSSPEGDEKGNLELSKERAESVKAHFALRCLEVENIIVSGKGEARLNGSYSDNRCVIVILKKNK